MELDDVTRISSECNVDEMHSKCNVCKKESQFICGNCQSIHYCSQKCQQKDWTHLGHEMICNDLKRKRDADQQHSEYGPYTKSSRTLAETPLRRTLPPRLLALLDNPTFIYDWVQQNTMDLIMNKVYPADVGFYGVLNESNWFWYFVYYRFVQPNVIQRNTYSSAYNSAINYRQLLFGQINCGLHKSNPAKNWTTNIEQLTLQNESAKKVVFRNEEIEVAVEHLVPNQILGPETHPNSSQFIRLESGKADIKIDNQTYSLNASSKDGKDTIVVPKNTPHTIMSKSHVKFYTIYSPPL